MASVIQQRVYHAANGHRALSTSGNARCYHGGPSIVGASIIDRQQGAAIGRLDFTDAQGGKGACDRKAATIKVHMRVTN